MFEIPSTAFQTIKSANDYIRVKATANWRSGCRKAAERQYADTEKKVASTLKSFFDEQIDSIKSELESLSAGKSAQSQAEILSRQIYNPEDWLETLIDKAFPVLAKAMEKTAREQIRLIQQNPLIDISLERSASEWLQSEGLQAAPGISTELPQWMKDAIEVQLRNTFSQPYWMGIVETTRDDIESFLQAGLTEGISIREMANQISRQFPSEYNMKRATLVARTESGHALNGARNLAIDKFKEEMGPLGDFVSKSWLSVLGNTTRDAHAGLDGTMANSDGLFDLNGVLIPWPSHVSLPPSDRCNCQCTVITDINPPPE